MKKISVSIISFIFLLSGIWADYSWKSSIKVQDLKKNRQISEIQIRYKASKGKIRMDFEDFKGKSSQGYRKNTYWIFKDNKIHIVDKKDKSVTSMSVEQMLQMGSMAGQLVNIKIEDYQLKKEELPTRKIAGVDCKHIKLHKKYKMKMKIAIMKKQMNIESEQELWLGSNMPLIKDASSSFMKKEYKTGFPSLDKMIEKEMEVYGKNSFLMKSVEKNTTRNKKGKVKSVILTTTTISEIKGDKFNPSIFEIPEGYKVNQVTKEKPEKKKKLGIF